MPINRFFSTQHFETSHSLWLEEGEFHHLAHVTRTKPGETVELINGQGKLASAHLIKTHKGRAELEIVSVYQEPPPPFSVILAQAIPRINRLDLIVEKGTELGMTALWLFPSLLSERKALSAAHLERLNKIAISAIKQSGRLYLPSIQLKPPLNEWERHPLPLFFGDLTKQAATLIECWKSSPPQDGVIFSIGPESGFDEREVEILCSLGARGVKLHENILRTDTASLAALAIIEQLRYSKGSFECL